MADTVVSDAVPFPVDEGLPNIADGDEPWASGGHLMALAQAVDSGSYARSDAELTFTAHDATNDQVDVTGGIAYLDLSGETVDVQSGTGGTSAPAYDTTLPTVPAIMIECPTTTADLPVQSGTLSSVWLAFATDGTVTGVSAGDVYLRSDDTGSVTAPPHPSVELGQANPDDATADVLTNRHGSPTFDELSTRQQFFDFADTTQVATPDRPLYTTESRTLYVDPVNGDDSLSNEEVDADNPLLTLDEAMGRIPQILYHEFTIDLAGANTISLPATYDSAAAMSGPPLILSTWNTTGVIPSLHIKGDVVTPSNVVVDTNFNLAITNAETDDAGADAVISGIQFDNYINNKGGLFSISDCIFTGATTSSAIFGKAGGQTHIENTEFQSGLDHVANLGNIGGEVFLTNCSGSVSQTVFELERGATGHWNPSNNSVSGTEGVHGVSNNGILWNDKGRPYPAYIDILDDFDDGRLFTRRITPDGHVYRPQWEIQSGSPSGNRSAGVAELPDGSTTSQQLRYSDHANRFTDWEIEFQAQSSPTSGRFVVYANGFGAPDRNGWQFEVDGAGGAGSLHVDKWDSQTETADVITGSWTPDTSWHSLRLTNDGAGGIEAFFDGTSLGTHSSSALDKQTNFLIVNELDAIVYADNLYVQ